MRSFSKIESMARQLLDASGVQRPPVDVKKIAHDKGAVVRYEDFEDGVSGALYRTSDRVIIGVNRADGPERGRFTIAHEIGHLVLGHQDDLFVDKHYVDSFTDAASAPNIRRIHRDIVSSQATNPLEIEANRFAAALLMPRNFLDASLAETEGPVQDKQVQRLAKRYEVSVQAMVFRLMNLGVPLDPA